MLAAEAGAADCFWTLTLGRRLVRAARVRPSCTRFPSGRLCALGGSAGGGLRDLDRTRPPILLFGTPTGGTAWTASRSAVTNPAIERYVLSRYRPWRRVGEHWFWKRAEVGAERRRGRVRRRLRGWIGGRSAGRGADLRNPGRPDAGSLCRGGGPEPVAAQQVAGRPGRMDRGSAGGRACRGDRQGPTTPTSTRCCPLCSVGGEIVGRNRGRRMGRARAWSSAVGSSGAAWRSARASAASASSLIERESDLLLAGIGQQPGPRHGVPHPRQLLTACVGG